MGIPVNPLDLLHLCGNIWKWSERFVLHIARIYAQYACIRQVRSTFFRVKLKLHAAIQTSIVRNHKKVLFCVLKIQFWGESITEKGKVLFRVGFQAHGRSWAFITICNPTATVVKCPHDQPPQHLHGYLNAACAHQHTHAVRGNDAKWSVTGTTPPECPLFLPALSSALSARPSVSGIPDSEEGVQAAQTRRTAWPHRNSSADFPGHSGSFPQFGRISAARRICFLRDSAVSEDWSSALSAS